MRRKAERGSDDVGSVEAPGGRPAPISRTARAGVASDTWVVPASVVVILGAEAKPIQRMGCTIS